MAKMKGNFDFTGRLGNISAYTMRGSDEIILRTKGGPSASQIKASPRLENTRRINKEFGGCSATGKWVRKMMYPQRALADFNISGPLNALLRSVQALDILHDRGQRDVCLSKNPKLLEGFNLNKRFTFDSIVRNPAAYQLSRDALTASVSIGSLLPGINFYVPGKYPLYSFIVVAGIIPDFFYTASGYKPNGDYNNIYCKSVQSEWYPALKGSPPVTLQTEPLTNPPDESFSLMLSVGIQFGTLVDNNKTEQLKHTGAAKIIGMT